MVAEHPVIYIVGAGITTPAHLSLESLAALESCQEIWTNIPETLYINLPGSLPSTIRSLKPFFIDNRLRIENYKAIIDHILARAEHVCPVGYLTQGNPIVFDTVTAGLIHEGRSSSMDVKIYPAISSIDTLLIDVLYDPAKGLQIHEATAFVRDLIVIDARAALLLLQPSVFGSRMPRLTTKTAAPDLLPLEIALRRFYPPDHLVKFVRSATGTMSSQIVESDIEHLSLLDSEATLASTLFVPPVPRESPLGSHKLSN